MTNQETFSRLWEGYETDKDAMRARNKRAKVLRATGRNVTCSTLRNQLRKYAGFGQPDGRSCSVYMLTAW